MSDQNKYLPLVALCTVGGHDSAVVAFDRAHRYDWAALKAGILAWEKVLKEHAGQCFAVSLSQVFEFTALLLAAIRCQKIICLAPQGQTEALLSMSTVVDGFIGEFDASCSPLSRPSVQPGSALAPVKLEPNLPVLILLSSGSTGNPKVIYKTLLQLTEEVAMLERQSRWGQSDAAIISTVSHLHFYGFIFRCLWPLCAGRPFCTDNILFIEDILAYLQPNTVWVTSPAHLKRLPDNPVLWARLQQNVSLILSAGGVLPERVVDPIQRQFNRFIITEIYGSSETGAIATKIHTSPPHYWQALPGVSWRIQPGTQQLAVHALHVAADWVVCDDVASLSKQGMTLLGRVDDMVKLEGKRVSLFALKQALATLPWVEEAYCCLVQSRRESVGAILVLSELGQDNYRMQGKKALSKTLQQALKGVVEPHAIPRRWRYLIMSPINAQGKVKKAVLSHLLQPTADQTKPLCVNAHVAGSHLTLQVFVPSTLQYLKGHFPHWAVVPGVAQLDWIMSYIAQYFDKEFTFKGVEAVKFTRPIEANTALKISLHYEADKRQTSYKIVSLLGEHASGRVIGREHEP
jgi:acyl-CoA synthetase (AMP-forming)/AMP-acid ligase II